MFAACAGFGVAWLFGAIALQASGSQVLRADIQRSKILQELNSILPPSGPILNALSRIDPLPNVAGPPADVPAPTRGVLASRGVVAAAPSVVKIVGTACGLGIEGSGWVAAPGLVITNAHVIAGETDTTVQVRGLGATLDAHPVEFDPINDIAVLRVPGLRAPALKLARRALQGTSVGILGFPLDGPYDRQPGRLGSTQVTLTEDAYGNGHFQRDISAVRGLIRPGNSGGPLIDRGGRVLGTVFAAITNAAPGQSGGFAVPNGVVSHDLAEASSRSGTVGSGACVS
jgi:S1-C subfamily serine protease